MTSLELKVLKAQNRVNDRGPYFSVVLLFTKLSISLTLQVLIAQK